MPSFTSSKFLLLGAAVLGLANASALPANIFGRQAATPDGSCGASNGGYKCPTDSYKCCSQYGWCGDTDEYCGTGCQSGYGTCSGGSTTPTTSAGGSTPTDTPSTGGRSKPGSVPYGSFIYSCNTPNTVALTFDDGPFIYTSRLLDILSSNGVKATFFVNGQNWGEPITTATNQAILARMNNEGHQIGSHTWSHPYLSSLSDADVTSQMTMVESAVSSAIGKYPTYMRPPYFDCGSACLNVMNNLGYHVIHANVDPQDYAHTADIQTALNSYSSAISAGGSYIVLNHDVHQTTVESLVQNEIDNAKSKGLTFATVGECLGDPAANWYRN
ncbi:glycoside hydrolase/deacetylase [Morchella conica CCBAS932]|uniref:Glycoside hydrolase/deacetylase n=1 Tax=Morchella conica CCBAS932 TaxID=1392247 RepID=A0A3N4KMP5_9PEZI|nr:glycoside hydrolase/deacetylase [Morchella conica CCBAS932]